MKNAMFLGLAAALATLPAVAWAAGDCPVRPPADLTSPGTLTIATHLTMPPQAFLDNDKPAGFAIEIGEAIAREMCLKAAFVNFDFAGLFPGLNARKFDTIIAGIGITPDRQKSLDFVPYFEGGVRLIVRKDSKLTFKSEDDLCGLPVATQSGSVEAISLERTNKERCSESKKIDIMAYPNFNEAVQQLRKKVADVAFLDWPFANYLAQAVPDLALGSPILSGTPGLPRNKHGIVVRKGDVAMSDALSEGLKRIEADGTYGKILAKWNVEEGDIRSVK
ncbi:MAG TPA: ABC transporter substrate-binding protein [Alphaproteobacteria bacterium]|nr:ABC transporter substrate-binding protein [Alphaproteobacteria bacterium]